MSRRQLASLFICNLAFWTVGNGLLPLLPVYAKRVGADAAATGYFLAFSYLALALGAILAGWLSDGLQRRKTPLIFSGLAMIPLTWLMGRAENIWGLALLTAVVWALGGLGIALLGILAGLSSGEAERGKIFGVISLTMGLGSLIGGLITGYVVDLWDFATLFGILAAILLLVPLAALFLTDKHVERDPRVNASSNRKLGLGRSYHFLFLASLAGSVAGFVIRLGISLIMDDLGFNALAISSTSAIGGFISMPIPFLMGWLSDRTGRKIYLYLGYVAGMASLLILANSASLGSFYLVAILQALFLGVNGTIGNALVTDLVPKESLGRGLALFGATAWIGGILGFAGAGYALQSIGVVPTFAIAMSLPVIAILLLVPVRSN